MPGHAGQTAMYLEINDLCQWKAVIRSKVAAMQSSRHAHVQQQFNHKAAHTQVVLLRHMTAV